MDCLFIHGNYPGQFKHLAPLLAQQGHRVVFLTNRADAKEYAQPGVYIKNYSLHRHQSENVHHYLYSTEGAVLQGQAVLRAISDLQEEGFHPRFVVTHGGMGLGLFIKDLLCQAVHIGYFEWYFQPDTSRNLVDEFNLDTQLNTGLRNLPILQELERCDVAVVPTQWQKQQFPKAYQAKIKVIFDGIDYNFFYPETSSSRKKRSALLLHDRETNDAFQISSGSRVLSYATRGMETLRCFPEFMRSLPELLENYSDLQVVIAGADRRAYSYNAPSHNGSWKEHLIAELQGKLDLKRILFTGLLNYDEYRSLLWRSNLHCYFTKPYVTSWSLFEAAACGASLATNNCEATSDILADETVSWVTIDNQRQLNKQLSKALEEDRANSQLLPGFELDRTLSQWEKLLNESIQSS